MGEKISKIFSNSLTWVYCSLFSAQIWREINWILGWCERGKGMCVSLLCSCVSTLRDRGNHSL